MKLRMLFMSAILMTGFGAFAQEEAASSVALAKATELAVHRIERLVTLKKIDAFFLSSLNSMRAETSSENGATFKVYGATEAGADGTALGITLWMDAQGKTLSFQVSDGTKPKTPVLWPVKDASSLMEEGLHFVLEGWAQHPEIKPFFTDFQSIVMISEQDAAGSLIASFTVKSNAGPEILTIRLKPDGTFVSYEVK